MSLAPPLMLPGGPKRAVGPTRVCSLLACNKEVSEVRSTGPVFGRSDLIIAKLWHRFSSRGVLVVFARNLSFNSIPLDILLALDVELAGHQKKENSQRLKKEASFFGR